MGCGGGVRPRRRVRRRPGDRASRARRPVRPARRRSARRRLRRGRLRARAHDRRARRALRPRRRRRRLAGMLERARAAVHVRRTSTSASSSGDRLDSVEDAIADTLVCYLVLQHLPERRVVLRLSRGVRARALGRRAARSCSCPCCDERPRAVRLAARRARVARATVRPSSRRGHRRGPRTAGMRLTRSGAPRRAAPPRGCARLPATRAPTVAVPLRARGVPAPGARRVTPLVLVIYGVLLAVGGGRRLAAADRRALRLHRRAGAAQPRDGAALRRRRCAGMRIDAVQAWKEVLLAVAVARVAWDADPRAPAAVRADGRRLARARVRSGRLPLRARSRRTCSTGRPARKAVLYGLPPRARPRRRVLPRPLARS